MKIPRVFFLTLFAGFVLFLSFFALIGFKAPMSCYGFAVDRGRNIYLAYNEQIQVYDPGGELIRRIEPTTSRGYDITIEDDQLILAHFPYVCVLDLKGHVLKRTELDDYDDFPRIPTWTDTDPHGNEYVLKKRLTPKLYRRTSDGDVHVFTAPLRNSISDILFLLYGLFMLVLVPVTVVRWFKLNPPKPGTLNWAVRPSSRILGPRSNTQSSNHPVGGKSEWRR